MEIKLRKVLFVLGFTLLASSSVKAANYDYKFADVPIEECLEAAEKGVLILKSSDSYDAFYKKKYYRFGLKSSFYSCQKMIPKTWF